MHPRQRQGPLRVGEVAARAGTTADTVRYYERLGLLRAPERSAGGYRLYGETELRRLQFVRRAKIMGLRLEEIGSLLALAEEGECRPLRSHVAELLRRKIDDCEAKLAEINAFKRSLEERYQTALKHQEQPACGCADFPEKCACLPVPIEELTVQASARASEPQKSNRMEEISVARKVENDARPIVTLRMAETLCECGCGCTPEALCDCGCGCAFTDSRQQTPLSKGANARPAG